MAGRCTECGTYHYDGPPCDNCGEMGFTPATKVVRCADCGTIHRDESPPCNNCGEMGFQRVENPGALLDDFEKPRNTGTTLTEDTPATPQTSRRKYLYGAGAVAVLAAGGYTVLASDDYPTNEAPGHAEEASGIRFETVETELRGLINDERGTEGVETLETAENVDAFATYYNKEYVKAGGNFAGTNSEEFDGEFNVSDYHTVGNHYGGDSPWRAIETFSSPSELARDCFESWMGADRFRNPLTSLQYQRIGLDVHVDEAGDIFLLAVVD